MKLGYAIPHEIRIRASANMGFIVKIGCGEFVAANTTTLLMDIEKYITEPDKWEKEYNALPGRSGPDAEARPEPSLERVTQPEPPTTET